MRISSVLLILFFTSLSHALDVSKKQGRVILQSTCTEGTDAIKSLSSWLSRTQPQATCKTSNQTNGNDCQYDITDCLPEQVSRYQGVTSKVGGPNCWNLALVMGKILPNLRYSSPTEMAFYMRAPLCHPLKDGETRQAGDIGAIRELAWGIPVEETHAFIYVSQNMVFSKNGSRQDEPYSLQAMNSMLDSYEVENKTACRKNEITKGNMDCNHAVAYYRCDSMDDYLKKNKSISPKVKNLERDITSTEHCLEASEFSSNTLSESNLHDIQRVSGALTHYLADLKKSNKLEKMSEADRFVVGGLQLRLQSIADQLSELRDGIKNSANKNDNLARVFDNAVRTLDENNSASSENDEAE